jgi:DNA-binding transcriptional ArsR family regulator
VEEAEGLAGLFEVLASPTRLRLLHALVLLDDPCMSDLAEAVDMKPQAVSNQLRKLVDLGILDTRRHGNHIHYRIVEPCVTQLLHHGRCINGEHPLRKAKAS